MTYPSGDETRPAPPTTPLRKWLFLIPAFFVLAIGLGWVGGILYWHFRVTQATRAWLHDFPIHRDTTSNYFCGADVETQHTLHEAGCRALPGLVKMLNETHDPTLRQGIVDFMASALSPKGGPNANPVMDTWQYFRHKWIFSEVLSEQQNEEVLRSFNAWWAEHRSEYHDGWRFWSRECHPPPLRNDSNP